MSTILVLEDEPFVLGVIRAVLQRTGRKVIAVETADEAIRAAEHTEGGIDLLVSDVILRNEKGPEVARRLLTLNPKMACLFVSGYPRQHLDNGHLLDSDKLGADTVAFLPKPFTPGELSAVCEWLLQPKGSEYAEKVATLGIASAEARFRFLSVKIATAMTYVEIAKTEHGLGANEKAEQARAAAKDVLAKATRELDSERWTVADHSVLRSALADLSSAVDSLWPAE